MKDWTDHYRSCPEDQLYHEKCLKKIANGHFFSSQRSLEALAPEWLPVALYNNNPEAAHRLLDALKVEGRDLTLRERISLFQLLGANT